VTPWALHHWVVQVALLTVGGFRLITLLHSLPAGLVRGVLYQLRYQLLTDLRGRLVSQYGASDIVFALVRDHVGKVSVLHILVQF
jgi:hypothetical protein